MASGEFSDGEEQNLELGQGISREKIEMNSGDPSEGTYLE